MAVTGLVMILMGDMALFSTTLQILRRWIVDCAASGIEIAAMYPNSLVLSCIVVLILSLLLVVENLYNLLHKKRSTIKKLYTNARDVEKQCSSLQDAKNAVEAQLGDKAVELNRISIELDRLNATTDAILLENQSLHLQLEERSVEIERLNVTTDSIKLENKSLLDQLEERSVEIGRLNVTTDSIRHLRAELEDKSLELEELQRLNDSITKDKETLFSRLHDSIVLSEQHLAELMAENEEKERQLIRLERHREVLLEQVREQSMRIDGHVISVPMPSRPRLVASSPSTAESTPRKVSFGKESFLSDVRVASISSSPNVEARAHQSKQAALQYQKWLEENSSSDSSFDQSPINDSFFVEPHELSDESEHFPMAADTGDDGDSKQYSISIILHQNEVDNLRQRLEEEKEAIVATLAEEKARLAASAYKQVKEL